MATLQDDLRLDITQYLKEIDRADKALDRLYRPRVAPPVPPVPPVPPAGGGGGGRGGQSAAQKELAELANRLKIAQNEIKQLGASATGSQLTGYAQQIAQLTARAQALGPGFQAGSREARNLSGLLLGLQSTAGRVTASLDLLAQGPRPVNDPAFLRQLRAEIQDTANKIATARNAFIAMNGAATPAQIRALVAEMNTLKQRTADLSRGLPQGSEELRRLSVAAATAERTIAGATGQMSRLGLASQVKLGVTSSLNDLRGQFGGVTNGIAGFAKFTDSSRVASALFTAQLIRMNLSMDQGKDVVTRLSDSLKILPSQAQDAIQVLLRNGFSLSQAFDALQRAGASAVARGRTAAEGVDLFGQAIQSQSSTMLNYIGIAGNLSDFYVQYARQIGTTSNQLTQQQKAQAAVNLVTRETTEELANLPLIQASLAGGFSDLTIAYQNFQKSIGKSFAGPVADTVKSLNSFVSFFSSLPPAAQDAIGKMVIFGVQLAIVLKVMALARIQANLFRAEVFGIGPAATGAAAGTGLLSGILPILTGNIQAATAALGPMKLAIIGIGAALVGYNIGQQLNDLDTGFGTLGQRIQMRELQGGNSILLKLLGVSPEDQRAAAQKMAEDLSGVTEEANRRYQQLASKGGTGVASATFARDTIAERLVAARGRLIEAQRTGNTEAVAGAQKEIDLYTRQIRLLDKRVDSLYKAKAAKSADVESTVAQDEAYAKLQENLAQLGDQFGSTKTTDFQNQLAAAQKALDGFNQSVVKALKNGDITKPQAAALQNAFKSATANVVPDLVTRQLDSNREAALSGQRDLEEARIALIRDATQRREAQLRQETATIREEYRTRIRDAQQNASARGLTPEQRASLGQEAVRLEGERDEKIRLARVNAGRELETIEREQANKILDAQKATAEEQLNVVTAGLAAVQERRDAALARTSDPRKQLEIERRFNGQVLAIRQEGLREQAQLQQNAAQRQLSEDLRAAQEGGDQRLQLETEARNRYALAIRNIETTTRTETNTAVREQEQRQQDLLATIYQRELDGVLKNLQTQTGAELESIRQRLIARRALFAAEGQTKLVDAVDGALARVTEQMSSNVAAFRERLRESRADAVDLRNKLADVAQTPLQKALASAAAPFNEAIHKAQEDMRGLNEAFGKAYGKNPTAAQSETLRTSLAEQQRIITEANRRRNEALVAAERQFVADMRAAAEELRGKLAELGPDSLQRQEAKAASPYDAIIADARKASSQLQAAYDHLTASQKGGLLGRSLQQELGVYSGVITQASSMRAAAVAKARQEYMDAVQDRTVTLERLESEQPGATDASYRASLNRVLADWRGRLAGLRVGSEDYLKAREKIAETQATLDGLDDQRASRPAAVRADQRADLQAALELARTDEQRVILRQQLITLDQADLAAARARLADVDGTTGPARAQEVILAARQRVRDVEKQITDEQRQQRETLDQLRTSNLALVGAAVDYQAVVARTNAEVQASKQAQVEQAQRNLADIDTRIVRAREEGATQAQINDLIRERIGAEGSLYQARRDAARYGVEVAQRELDLQEAQLRATAQLSGMAEDAVASAQLDLDVTRRQLANVEDQLALAEDRKLTDAEINDLQVRRLGLLGQEAEQQRKLSEAERQRRDLLESIQRGAVSLSRSLAQQPESTITTALDSIAESRDATTRALRAYQEAQADVDRAPTSTNLQRLQQAQDALTSSIQGQRKAVQDLATAYRDQLASMDSVRDATERLRSVVQPDGKGARFDPNLEQDRLAAIQARRDAAVREAQAAITSGDARRIAQATSDLATQQERYRKQLELLRKNGLNPQEQGAVAVGRILNQLDRLGINYDAQAVELQRRADLADQEAKTALTLGDGVDRFGTYVDRLLANLPTTTQVQQVVTTYYVYPERQQQQQQPAAAQRASVVNNRGGDTITFNIPITLENGQTLPTPGEFRHIAEDVFQSMLDAARRNQAWNRKDC